MTTTFPLQSRSPRRLDWAWLPNLLATLNQSLLDDEFFREATLLVNMKIRRRRRRRLQERRNNHPEAPSRILATTTRTLPSHKWRIFWQLCSWIRIRVRSMRTTMKPTTKTTTTNKDSRMARSDDVGAKIFDPGWPRKPSRQGSSKPYLLGCGE